MQYVGQKGKITWSCGDLTSHWNHWREGTCECEPLKITCNYTNCKSIFKVLFHLIFTKLWCIIFLLLLPFYSWKTWDNLRGLLMVTDMIDLEFDLNKGVWRKHIQRALRDFYKEFEVHFVWNIKYLKSNCGKYIWRERLVSSCVQSHSWLDTSLCMQ